VIVEDSRVAFCLILGLLVVLFALIAYQLPPITTVMTNRYGRKKRMVCTTGMEGIAETGGSQYV